MQNSTINHTDFQAALKVIQDELAFIKSHLLTFPSTNSVSEDWITKKVLQNYLGYGETRMAEFLKEPSLVVKEIGNRKFINKQSFIQYLEKQ